MNKRHRQILEALRQLGGKATTRQIAAHLHLNVNGVAQSLGALYQFVNDLGGQGGDRLWELK